MCDKISVILPIYNVEKYLKQALDSVINQTYTNIEIILVDDGSPDYSGKICDEYAEKDNRIKVIHKKNGGVSSARNMGIDAATGQWLCFIDPDDWVEFNMLEEALYKAQETNSDLCIWDFEFVDDTRNIYFKAIRSNCSLYENSSELEKMIAFNCSTGSIWNFIVKSNLIKNKIYFDESLSFREDEIFKLELYQNIKKFCYLPKLYYHYRMTSESACHKLGISCVLKNLNIYKQECKIIASGIFPKGSQIVANSKLLEGFSSVVDVLIKSKMSFYEKKKVYDSFVKSEEYQTAIDNYDSRYFDIFSKLCLRFKRLPYIIVFLLRKIIDMLKSKYV